jgi:hypothetical protein
MTETAFDPKEFYDSYPKRVILRPGYPARAQYKSTILWHWYGKAIMKELGEVNTYADIGGCFGFSANSMGFQISQAQGRYPECKVFELSSEFATVGRQLFPYIDFVLQDFREWNGTPKTFDLVTLFDLVEHLVDPEEFLSKLALHMRLALLKTPMETLGEWRGGKPLTDKIGDSHRDGHINFFTPKSFLELLKRSHLEIVGKWRLISSIVPSGAERILIPGTSTPKGILGLLTLKTHRMAWRILPKVLIEKIRGGGDLVCLVRPNKAKKCMSKFL